MRGGSTGRDRQRERHVDECRAEEDQHHVERADEEQRRDVLHHVLGAVLLDLFRLDRRCLAPILKYRIDKRRTGHCEFFRHLEHRRGNAAQTFEPLEKFLKTHIRRAEQIFFLMSSLLKCSDERRRCIASVDKTQTAARRIRNFAAKKIENDFC